MKIPEPCASAFFLSDFTDSTEISYSFGAPEARRRCKSRRDSAFEFLYIEFLDTYVLLISNRRV